MKDRNDKWTGNVFNPRPVKVRPRPERSATKKESQSRVPFQNNQARV